MRGGLRVTGEMGEMGVTTEAHRVEVTMWNYHVRAAADCASARGNLQKAGEWTVLGLRREVGMREERSGKHRAEGSCIL